jgi:hypothetical protein
LGGPKARNARKKVDDDERGTGDEERNEGEDSEKDTPRTKLATIQKQ